MILPSNSDWSEAIEVSPEMTALLGCGIAAGFPVPAAPIALIVGFGQGEGPQGAAPSLHLDMEPDIPALTAAAGAPYRQVFLVAREAMLRLGGAGLMQSNHRDFFLPGELRATALSLREPPACEALRTTWRLAKSIEFLCQVLRLFQAGELTPMACDGGALSAADTRRILAARRMIEERWSEKLTLDGIARACGLNRAKLTRGFKEMFEQTVAEAMAERRLKQASLLLLTTDLPVSSVGYESGYLNNASFARAFGRHFGRSPSDYRANGASLSAVGVAA